MPSTGTNRIGAALLALSLALPSRPQDAQAQTPVAPTPNRAIPTERATESQRKVAISEERIAQRATAAHVGLTIVQESGSGYGSGVLVQPSAKMERLLHHDEVLVLSVSHNAANWTDHSRVYGTLFTPEAQTRAGRALKRENYPARVIGRFINTDEERGILTTSRTNIDVAYMAIRVPADQLEAVKARALPVSAPSNARLKIGATVYAVGSRGVEEHPSGRGLMVSKPNFRKGIVLNPNSQETEKPLSTQLGRFSDNLISTTIQCEPGDSGGALVRVNEGSGELEVIGVCSGGGETEGGETGWIDFPVDQAGVTQEQINRYGLAGAVLRVLPQARSPYRGLFTGVPAGAALEEALAIRYARVLEELEEVDVIYGRFREEMKQDGAPETAMAQLETLYRKARAKAEAELHEFKPARN